MGSKGPLPLGGSRAEPWPSLLHVFPTFAVGGSQVRFAAIANRFGRAWRHAIVAMDGDTACRERLRPDLAVTFPNVALRKGDTPGNLLRCRRALLDLRPDVLVTYNWGSIEWAMANLLVRVRHVHIEDGFGPEERARQLPRRVWVRRLVLRRAIVVLPSRTLERIALDIWRLPRRRVRHIPNGVDLKAFLPPLPLREGGEGTGRLPVIGTVAALRAEKNIARLLQAFALLAVPARLVIIGDGPERAGLEALALELGIAGSVHFAGHLAEPQAAYREFDLFALSSDTEQMPLSVLEAMAAGLAVAATDVGDVASMLAGENRPYVVACDAASLAGAMGALLADPALRRRIGAANRAEAEHNYDQERMFLAYAALFDESYRGVAPDPHQGP
jgi:glycosyltransferase involved in cell wall biosynthesis